MTDLAPAVVDIDRYERDGYAVVDGVLSPATIAHLRDVVDGLLARDDDALDVDESGTPRRIKDPVATHPAFEEVMRSDAVLDAVADVLGSSFRFHSSKLNLKGARGGAAVQWHQDFAFFPHTNDDLVACGIALDDADEANGCLLVLPGSHRGPVLDHHQDGRFVGAVPADDPALHLSQAVAVPLRAGSMSMHHARLLHASATNTAARPRRMLFLQFVAADSYPLSYAPVLDVPPLDVFARLVVRGEPSTRARLVDVTVELPRFGGSYTSIYDVQERLHGPGVDASEVTS